MTRQLRPETLSSVGKVLYMNEEHKDLTLIIQEDIHSWRFPAHRLVIASECPVLRTQLEDKNISEITLTGLSPRTAEHLLQYIYCGNLELENWSQGLDLLQAAHKYGVKNLVIKCGRFLEDVISPWNVCSIMEKASTYSQSLLYEKCLKLILDAGFLILKMDSFTILNKNCIMDILGSPSLNINSELVVFESLFHWARIECCRKGVSVTQDNILTQIVPYLDHVCIDDMSDADKSALPPSILACVKPNNRNRVGFMTLDSLFSHASHLELDINHNVLDVIGDSLSCIRFSVDSPIHVIELKFSFVFHSLPDTMPFKIVKENSPFSKLLSQDIIQTSSMQSTHGNQGEWHEATMRLKHPVFLKEGNIYRVHVANGFNVQCPKTTVSSHTLKTTNSLINFVIYGDNVWCVIGITII